MTELIMEEAKLLHGRDLKHKQLKSNKAISLHMTVQTLQASGKGGVFPSLFSVEHHHFLRCHPYPRSHSWLPTAKMSQRKRRKGSVFLMIRREVTDGMLSHTEPKIKVHGPT
jgi:hypothetical protein